MPESPSSSFIPKRGPGKKPASARSGNFVLFSIVSYALFVSAPLASAGVFIYERHAQNQFNKAVVALDQAIINFNEEDLKRVTEFNERLITSKLLIETHASIVSLLQAIENSTAKNVEFKSIDIARTDKSMFSVIGLLSTESFDGALFQRSSYIAADIIKNPLFTDVKLVQVKEDEESSSASLEKRVELKVTFNFAVADVLYTPLVTNESELPQEESNDADEPMSSRNDTTAEALAVSGTANETTI